jgi:hypothetical protein
MQKIRTYISVLMLALIVFPTLEKTMHEIGHLAGEHCAVKEIHFCVNEHHCNLCDYIFSASSTPPQDQNQINVIFQDTESDLITLVSDGITSLKYSFSLRGPPLS